MVSQKGKLLTWDSGEKMLQPEDREINEKKGQSQLLANQTKGYLKNKGKVLPRQKSGKFNDLK